MAGLVRPYIPYTRSDSAAGELCKACPSELTVASVATKLAKIKAAKLAALEPPTSEAKHSAIDTEGLNLIPSTELASEPEPAKKPAEAEVASVERYK